MNFDLHHRINKRLLFETAPIKADIAILLGAKSVSGDIAREATEHQLVTATGLGDYFNNIVLCGGNRVFQPHVYVAIQRTKGSDKYFSDFFSPRKEADYMRRVLIGEGIPDSNIIFSENRSQHTGDNFANIRAFVRDNGITTANVYTVAYGARRAVETAAVQIPELKCNPVAVYPYGLSREDWLERWPETGIRNVVIGEYEKLNPENTGNYYRQGHCKPVVI